MQEAESVEDEEAYGPGESALALTYEDDAGPDVYAGMDMDLANVPLLPMRTAVPSPPLGSCGRRHCRFHADEGAYRHHLTGAGRRKAGLLEGALERSEFQHPGKVAQEKSLVAKSPDNGQVRRIQPGDAAVLDHHPGEIQAAEPQESLPLSVRLSVGCLLDEAGLEDVCRDSGLCVALWRGVADAWRRWLAVRPLTPPALGSHALLVAMHSGGVEVVFGENGTDRLLLAHDSAILVPIPTTLRAAAATPDCWWWWTRARNRARAAEDPNRTRSRWGRMRQRAVRVTQQRRSGPQRRSRNRVRTRARRRWPTRST